jgi:membrane-bound lytic murein transglycosylase MltF
MDQHLAEFWGRVFPNLSVHTDLVVADDRDIAWAFRKSSPKLKDMLNEFLMTHRPRTEFGNIILRRYLQTDSWVLHTTSATDRERFEQTMPLFQKYGELYQVDPLFLAALGYQESRLDQNIRSPAGAIGVMQLLPQTGEAMNVGDIYQTEPNIHAGTRYLRSLMDQVQNPDVDRLNSIFFALASYNAGQTRIRRLRREAAHKGLDANVWLNNVELVVANEVGREPVQYVRNIYLYYLSFRRVEAKRAQRAQRTASEM